METCPYHDVEPESETLLVRNEIVERYVDRAGEWRTYRLPRLESVRLYCRRCLEAGGRMPNRFGRGMSGDSREKAERQWNKACESEKLRLFKKAVTRGS